MELLQQEFERLYAAREAAHKDGMKIVERFIVSEIASLKMYVDMQEDQPVHVERY